MMMMKKKILKMSQTFEECQKVNNGEGVLQLIVALFVFFLMN